MNIKVFLAILLIFTQSHNDFLKKVFTNFVHHSYYVCINIEYKNCTKEIIIENAELYLFYHDTKKMKQEEYAKFMLDFFKKENKIKLQGKIPYNKYSFREVHYNKKVEDIAKKGEKYFINYYFNNYVIKKNVSLEEQSYIIKKLFDWKILTFTDDYTGYLRYLNIN